MTCIDKLRELKPWLKDLDVRKYIDRCCPHEFGIAEKTPGCSATYNECLACWKREVIKEEEE